jgi:hypothetical protein
VKNPPTVAKKSEQTNRMASNGLDNTNFFSRALKKILQYPMGADAAKSSRPVRGLKATARTKAPPAIIGSSQFRNPRRVADALDRLHLNLESRWSVVTDEPDGGLMPTQLPRAANGSKNRVPQWEPRGEMNSRINSSEQMIIHPQHLRE